MVCDDDKDIVTTLTMGLKRPGFEVHGFNDPALALQHIEDGCEGCHVMVTDFRMPNMNGFQLVRRVREVRPDLKVVMMTAFEVSKPEFETVFPSMMAEGVLRKPFSISRLIEIIKEMK